MATATDRQQRARMYLKMFELMVTELPEVAAEWSTLSEAERESWRLDWSNEMFGLRRLAGHVSDGALSTADQKRYRQVLHRLKAALPLVNRLNLRLPAVPLDDDEDALIARYIEPNPHKPAVEEARLTDYGISVWAIMGYYLLALNRDVDEVARAYDVPREAVEAAIAYYRRHQCAIDTRLAANEA
jgi:uncharacterized protein (DUF433 family)